MPRDYLSGFITEKNKVKNSQPFLTAIFRFSEIDSRAADIAVIGRGIVALGGLNPTILGVPHFSIITNWGAMGSTFGRAPDGQPDVQETQLTLCNFPDLAGLRISDLFAFDFEIVPIDFYWNYLIGSTVHQEIETSGAAHSPTSYGYKEAILRVTSLMDKYLLVNMLRTITPTTHPSAEESAFSKNISIALGDTTENGVDGARIPAIRIEGRRSIYLACEDPPEINVSSIGLIYYDRHAISEVDFGITQSDTSKTVSLNPTTEADAANGNKGGIIPDVFDVGFLGSMANNIRLGDDTQQISHVIQPFTPRGDVSIVHAVMSATRYDTHSPIGDSIVGPLRALTMGIMNEDDALNDGGLLSHISTAVADITRWRHRSTGTSQPAPTTGPEAPDLEGASYFNTHGFRPESGKQHYAVFYIEGSNAGISPDPEHQWYNIGFPGSSVPNYSGITFDGPAYLVDWDGIVTRHDREMPLQFMTNVHSLYLGVQTLEDGGFDDTGASGVFTLALEPQEAMVVAGMTGSLKKRVPLGNVGDTELKGSLMFSIIEVDSHGFAIQTLASAEFTADEMNPLIEHGAFSDHFKRFGSPVLLEVGKHYVLKCEGQIDATGQFGNWVVQAWTSADWTAWSARMHIIGEEARMQNTGVSVLMPCPWKRTFVTTNFDESIGMGVKLHMVHFTRYQDNDEAGRPVWFLQGGIADKPEEEFVVPEGVAISFDANCIKTNPNDVFHAFLNRARVPDVRIDLAGTFADTAANSPFKLRGAITDQQTYKQFFIRAAFETCSNFDWEADKAQLKLIPMPGDDIDPVRIITLSDIAFDGDYPKLTVQRTEETDIINVIDVLFQRMFDLSPGDLRTVPRFQSAFLLGETFFSLTSVESHNEKRKPELFWMQYIRDIALAERFGLFCILWFAHIRKKPILTTGMQCLELMKDDVITLTLAPSAHTGSGDPMDTGSLGDDTIGPLGEDSMPTGGLPTFDGFGETAQLLVLGVTRRPPDLEIDLVTVEL